MVHKILNLAAIVAVVFGAIYCLIPFYRNFPEIITQTESIPDTTMYTISSHLFIMAIAVWVGVWFNSFAY